MNYVSESGIQAASSGLSASFHSQYCLRVSPLDFRYSSGLLDRKYRICKTVKIYRQVDVHATCFKNACRSGTNQWLVRRSTGGQNTGTQEYSEAQNTQKQLINIRAYPDVVFKTSFLACAIRSSSLYSPLLLRDSSDLIKKPEWRMFHMVRHKNPLTAVQLSAP